LKLPKFASFLDGNGDSHLGILIGFERIEEDIFFKIFLDVDKLNRKRKIELSYEEKYKSELRTDKETIDHMTYKIYMIQADLITQIYNDQIDSGKSSQV